MRRRTSTQSHRDEQVLSALATARMRGSWWRSDCPFCIDRVGKPDKDKCLSVHSVGGGFKCFRCGVRGRVELPDGYTTQPVVREPDADRSIKPPEGFVEVSSPAAQGSLSLEPALAYLRSRNLLEEVWEEAHIGACVSGLYAGRVVVPVLAEDNATWLGFSSRIWTKNCDKRLKYRNATGEWKSTTIYNPNALTEDTDEHCYIVEGCFDALALWPDAVAVLGDATDTQVAMLAKARRPLVVVLDGDAWQKGWSLAMKLRLYGVRAGAIQLPVGKDPDEMDPSWLWEAARDSLV